MLKRKSVFAGVGIALAIAMPLSLFTAIPAGAVAVCETTTSPNHASSLSGLKVGCIVDVTAAAAGNTNHLDVHDATNAVWRRGAARTVAGISTTTASTTITFAVGSLATTDKSRPISGTGIGATAFIRSLAPLNCVITTCTSAVLSVASTATGSTTALVEHTTSRVVTNASYTAGAASTITAVGANFVAADIRKSVSGGSFPPGARITAVGVAPGNTATVSSPAVVPVAHPVADDVITIGAVQYAVAAPLTNLATTYTETFTREMKKAPAPGTASCAGSTLTITAAGGGANAADVQLKVFFVTATGAAAAGGPWKVNSNTATTLVLSAACPLAAAWTNVIIGEPGANAPDDLAPMASLTAALNLSPGLNVTSDDCNKNTYEGFQVIGAWNNPGAFATTGVLGAPPDRAIGQIAFLTSVVSFAGYIVPKTVAEATSGQAVPHYDFTFPTLPTSLAVCPLAPATVPATTTAKTMINLGFWATTLTVAPYTPTGSGNPSAPSVRQIGPQVSPPAFAQRIEIFNGATKIGATLAPVGCTVIARTVTPTFANDCGLG